MRTKLPRYEVKVGQVWRDCDKRMIGRRIVVKEVRGAYAYCETVGAYPRKVRILVSRFVPNSTGFALEGGHS